MWIKECLRCHCQFEALGNRALYCPECKPKHINEAAALRKKKSRTKQRIERDKKKPVVSVEEMDRRSKAAGLNYGQYVAKYGEVEK